MVGNGQISPCIKTRLNIHDLEESQKALSGLDCTSWSIVTMISD